MPQGSPAVPPTPRYRAGFCFSANPLFQVVRRQVLGVRGGSLTLGTPLLPVMRRFRFSRCRRDGAHETGRQGDCKPGGVSRLPTSPCSSRDPPGGDL